MKKVLLKLISTLLLIFGLASFCGCKKEPLIKEIVGKWQLIESGMDEESSLTPIDTAVVGIVVKEYSANMTARFYNCYEGVLNEYTYRYKIDKEHLTIVYCDDKGNYNPNFDVHIYEYMFEDNNNYLITHHIKGIISGPYPQYFWHKYKRINE